MRSIPHRLPLPAMIIACVALVVALGGVSYAAGVLPKNSVGTAQLQKKAVTGAKLKKNAVTSLKVKDGTLQAADFKTGQLPAGPKGDPGPKGDNGAAGAPGVSAYEIVHWTASPVNVGDLGHVQVECPAGKKALGGGLTSGQPVATIASAPTPDGTVWYVNFKNVGVQATSVAAYAICAQVG